MGVQNTGNLLTGPNFGTPIVVNGQTTALATGSLTTLARADHVHTVSNVLTLLGSISVSTAAPSVTFTNIPSTVNNLICYYTAQGTTTTQNYELLSIRYNGASAVYPPIYYSTQDSNLAYEARISIIPPGNSFPSGQHGGGFFTIHDIQNTARHKFATSGYGNQNNTTARNIAAGFYAALWESTAAITSVTFLATIANLAVGSKFYLYGYP